MMMGNMEVATSSRKRPDKRTKGLSSPERKARRAHQRRNYNKQRIFLNTVQFQRWLRFRERFCVQTDSEAMKLLLDSFEVFHDPYSPAHTSSPFASTTASPPGPNTKVSADERLSTDTCMLSIKVEPEDSNILDEGINEEASCTPMSIGTDLEKTDKSLMATGAESLQIQNGLKKEGVIDPHEKIGMEKATLHVSVKEEDYSSDEKREDTRGECPEEEDKVYEKEMENITVQLYVEEEELQEENRELAREAGSNLEREGD